jgi:hypothetical protein
MKKFIAVGLLAIGVAIGLSFGDIKRYVGIRNM